MPILFKIQLLKTSPQKQKEQRKMQLDAVFDVFSLPVHFEFFAIFSYCLHFVKFVCMLVKETAKIETGVAEKSSWARQTYGKN